MKSHCCGAEIKPGKINGHWYQVCDECGMPVFPMPSLKLTPEQVKAIRWPTKDYPTANADLVIRYALQDLLPEEK